MPEFVYSVGIHTLFRGLAILGALVLLWKAYVYGDIIIGAIGVATLVIDSITFSRALSVIA